MTQTGETLSEAMLEALHQAINEAGEAADVRVVILAAKGPGSRRVTT